MPPSFSFIFIVDPHLPPVQVTAQCMLEDRVGFLSNIRLSVCWLSSQRDSLPSVRALRHLKHVFKHLLELC
ncbi:hypothetical protein EXN66_Car021011 [Channa argus]|uniref:Uncharacterized protein n=1 Tax=Channa argus TaxID=215402 RepID=A0A6G1QRG9_CHAAH|nr:hypothetical protein EXN66_Car021011 [Channa argus]